MPRAFSFDRDNVLSCRRGLDHLSHPGMAGLDDVDEV